MALINDIRKNILFRLKICQKYHNSNGSSLCIICIEKTLTKHQLDMAKAAKDAICINCASKHQATNINLERKPFYAHKYDNGIYPYKTYRHHAEIQKLEEYWQQISMK